MRNSGRRKGEQLDSLQTLFLWVKGGVVAEVKVAVDDEDAVECILERPELRGIGSTDARLARPHAGTARR